MDFSKNTVYLNLKAKTKNKDQHLLLENLESKFKNVIRSSKSRDVVTKMQEVLESGK